MFDTYVTIVGNVMTMPEMRRTANTHALVTSFKVASTARRVNKETGEWVDGNSLRVRVSCWRRLADSVATCVRTGDPVVVAGRLYTRDWRDEAGNTRLSYELEAVAVGHDLSRGTAEFTRNKATVQTSMVEDDETDSRAGGVLTEPLAADGEAEGEESWPPHGGGPFAVLHGDGLDEVRLVDDPFSLLGGSGDDEPEPPAPEESDESDEDSKDPGEGGNPAPGTRRRPRRGRVPVPA